MVISHETVIGEKFITLLQTIPTNLPRIELHALCYSSTGLPEPTVEQLFYSTQQEGARKQSPASKYTCSSWGLKVQCFNTPTRSQTPRSFSPTIHGAMANLSPCPCKIGCAVLGVSEVPARGSLHLPRLCKLVATPGRQRQARRRRGRRRPPQAARHRRAVRPEAAAGRARRRG